MNFENISELKGTLKEFQSAIQQMTKEDKEYKGEADELIAALSRVNTTLKDVDNQEQLKKLIGDFGWDFFHVFMTTQEMLAMDEDMEMEMDFDFEEGDLEEFELKK